MSVYQTHVTMEECVIPVVLLPFYVTADCHILVDYARRSKVQQCLYLVQQMVCSLHRRRWFFDSIEF